MADDSDSALVARSRLGDAGAFSALVRRHLRAAISVGLAVLQSSADAEDNAQDAFVVAYQALGTCKEPARFGAWLLRIVRTRALNRLAQRKVRAEVDVVMDEATSSEAEAEQLVLRRHLMKGLAALTQVQREVVLLHDLEGWAHAEIAQALELSETNSRQHLFQARKALRAKLSEAGDE